ncbi:protein Jumonji-like isoform X1 [Haliotis cracherodii]|uniref:protein Jumonji-like isoform X1 n=1 Tax=Haliotis cracherodii TaxID=6455 RepID=UPI0039EC7525
MGKYSNVPMTRRSHSVGGINLARRPKRNVSIKTYDDTVGLSRTEERELKKALYASLQECKRLARYQLDADEQHVPQPVPRQTRPIRSRSWPYTPSVCSTATPSTCVSVDESSQDSVKSSVSSVVEQKTRQERKIHAQRKFAQGSLPPTPSTTPVKVKASPIKLLPRRAKTEDFLTFLCLRGSSVLPPHLDFFNFSRGEPSHGEISAPETPPRPEPGSKCERTRESTPESSSVSTNDELYEIGTPSPCSVIANGRNGVSARKAARASASTPETARGIVSLSQGLTKKATRVSTPHRGRKSGSVDKTPSPRKGSPLVRGSPSKRGFAVKSLSPQFSKTPPKKKLSLKQKALLPFMPRKASTKHGSHREASSKQAVLEGSQSSHSSFKPVDPVSLHRKSSAHTSRSLKERLKRKKELVEQKFRERAMKKTALLKGKLKMRSHDTKKGGRVDEGTRKKSGRMEEHPRKKRMVRRSSVRLKELTKAMKAKKKRRRVMEMEEEEVTITLPRPSRPVGRKRNFAPRPVGGGGVTDMPRFVPEEEDFQMYSDDDDDDDEVSFGKVSSPRPQSVKERKEKSSGRKKKVVGMRTRSSIQKVVSSPAKIVASKRLSAVKKLRKTKGDQMMLSKIIEKRRRLKQEDGQGEAAKRGRKPTGSKKLGSPEKQSRSDSALKADLSSLMEVPTFRPSEEEFRDPIQYIESIREQAEPFGMCQIIPPSSWKCESKINEDMRFTAQVQLVHKLYKRWGPNIQFTASANKHLGAIGADLEPSPQIGGVEVDLYKLSRTIMEFGGMQNVVDKKKWVKIADAMKIPKLAQDRGMRLYDVYCKYLLPYDTLSMDEKTCLEQSVMSERQRKEKSGKGEDEEAIVKGKSNPLSTFNRVARNVRSMWFKDEPTPEQVECEYWRLVEGRSNHVAVQCGHVSTSTQGSGFPSKKDSPYARHSWNLNNLSDNPKCILRCLGPVSGATIPTLHIGMLFATSCWCTDVHHLPYIQYLHTGADIVWYSIPKQQEGKLKTAMKELVPSLVSHEDPRWLKEDTVMVNPSRLTSRGVTVSRCVQRPKTFVAIFPKSYTATISCGYNVSESVHYATRNWISTGVAVAEDLSRSVEPELFSMDALLCHLVSDPTSDVQTLKMAVPFFDKVLTRELSLRKQLHEAGLKVVKRGGMLDDMPAAPLSRKRSLDHVEDNVCDISKKHCYFSKVVNESENLTLSLEEGLKHIQKKKHLKHCKLVYRYPEEELRSMLQSAQCRLDISGNSDGASSSSSKKRSMKR